MKVVVVGKWSSTLDWIVGHLRETKQKKIDVNETQKKTLIRFSLVACDLREFCLADF